MNALKINKIFSVDALKATDPLLFVCDNPEERKCSQCLKYYIPTNKDISTRRPSTYFKMCPNCRAYMRCKQKEYKERNGLRLLIPPEH
jgi:hypothetical protein